jgi:hypothetical protein
MTKLTYYIQNEKVKKIIELSESLRKCLEYPNSENSMDERRYSEHFEKEILKIIKTK